MQGFDSSKLSDLVSDGKSSDTTEGLGSITMTGFTVNDLGVAVNKISTGATKALGIISMDGYDASDLHMMAIQITAGSTKALDKIISKVLIKKT